LTDLVRWLDDRRPPAPPSLRRAMQDAVDQGDPGVGSVSERLAASALDALGRVVVRPSTRARALELLAADALLTYACEAAAEPDAEPDSMERLMGALDLQRFADLLQEVER
jgi:hypothetical protein